VADSLILNNQIQFLGLQQYSGAQAAGAVYTLARGTDSTYDMGAPQPLTDIVSELILDGERPKGIRSGNRTIVLPVIVRARDRMTLAKAVELLLQIVDNGDDPFPLTWAPDPGPPLPLVFQCFRATATTADSDLLKEKQLVKIVTITLTALPFGESDTPVSVTFASPSTGSTPPPSPVTVDDYSSLGPGSGFSASSQAIIGTHSAHWNSASGDTPFYTKTGLGPLDITGRTTLSFYLGLGSTSSNYSFWRSGTVNFTLTLTDGTTTITIGGSQHGVTSNNTSAPTWQQVTVTIPAGTALNMAHVTGYTFTCWNFSYFGTTMTADVYLNGMVAQPVSTGVAASVRGVIYTLYGVLGSARAPLNLTLQQAPVSLAESVTYSTPGAIPNGGHVPEAGVTVLTVEKWGAGAPGGSRTTSGQATGGKGGEYTKNTAFACTPGVPNPGFVPSGGVASTTAPTNGGDAWFGANDSTAAHGGTAPPVNTSTAFNTANGTSTDPTHNAGGAPAAGGPNGGGGGESGGPSGPGNAASGATGGTGLADAGDGGAGRSSTAGNGSAGSPPGGGGGGAFSSGSAQTGGNGGNGQIRVSWTRVLQPFTTLLAHRPGPSAPQDLSPFVSVGGGSDVPNGSTEYQVPSLVAGTLADFDGTYTIMAVVSAWNSPSSPRNLFVTVKQYEYSGGPSYSQPTATRTLTPSTDTTIGGGLVSLGELTLPIKEVADDNTTGYYTVTITSSNTSDRFLDVLFLDVAGSLIALNCTGSGYPTMLLDEPDPDKPIGLVLGTSFDRAQAIGILDQVTYLSGGPLTLEPAVNNLLFLYSPQGAPAAVASYRPRYRYNRTA
jgi:hypothetical protein